MAKHTPGPWAVEDPFGPNTYSIVQAGLTPYEWQFIADVRVGTPAEGMMPRQEAQANARLIAAAPDLLALVKEMVACLDPKMVEAHDGGGLVALGITHSDTDCSLCKARALIAKAEA